MLFIPEASPRARQKAQKDAQSQLAEKFGSTSPVGQLIGFLGSTVWTPLASFFQKNGIAVGAGILAFVLLFTWKILIQTNSSPKWVLKQFKRY